MYEMSKRIGYCMTVRGAVLQVARPVASQRTIGKIENAPQFALS